MSEVEIHKIKLLPAIFRNNSFSNNFLVVLFFAAFVIIAIDLNSDLATEKDEIGTVLAIIKESYSNVILSTDFLSTVERPLLFELALNNLYPKEHICKSSVTDRGPPEVN